MIHRIMDGRNNIGQEGDFIITLRANDATFQYSVSLENTVLDLKEFISPQFNMFWDEQEFVITDNDIPLNNEQILFELPLHHRDISLNTVYPVADNNYCPQRYYYYKDANTPDEVTGFAEDSIFDFFDFNIAHLPFISSWFNMFQHITRIDIDVSHLHVNSIAQCVADNIHLLPNLRTIFISNRFIDHPPYHITFNSLHLIHNSIMNLEGERNVTFCLDQDVQLQDVYGDRLERLDIHHFKPIPNFQ